MDAASIVDGVASFASADADFPAAADVAATPLIAAAGDSTTFAEILAACVDRGATKTIVVLGRNLL